MANIEIDDSELPEAEFPIEVSLSVAAQKQVEGHNKFAVDLYRLTAAGEGDRFFSPASVAAVRSPERMAILQQSFKRCSAMMAALTPSLLRVSCF
jgi:hypothetical protein